jgi:hypothetical protein
MRGVMRPRTRCHFLLEAALPLAATLACGTATAAGKRDLCDQLVAFAQAIPKLDKREIALFLPPGEEGIACRREQSDVRSERFCSWLVEHSSWEYMEFNVRHVLSCLESDRADDSPSPGRVESMAGKLTFTTTRLPHTEGVVFEVEYSVRSNGEPDQLRISVSRLGP